MKPILNYLLAVLALCSSVCAQDSVNTPSPSKLDEYMETGMEVAGVRAPYYDEDGNLKAELYGEYARILEDSIAEVSNIRIDIFEDGEVVMTVFAPQCFTRIIEKEGKKILSVKSDGDVLIDMEQMTIFGHGFHFTSENNRFEIKADAKVLVKESAANMKGLSL